MTKPLVSVIIPTYKRADRINHAVDSVVAQTYGIDNIEIIVVSDNKKEFPEYADTDRKLKEYQQLPHFQLIHTAGGTGGGAARNYSCKYATGEYLAFLDDDDEFLPDKIETQVQFMQSNHLDMSYQDVSWYDFNSKKLVEHRRLNHVTDFSKNGLLQAHMVTPIAPTAIYMLTGQLFDQTDGFGEVPVGQDWFLMLRCIEAGAKIGYMPEVHVHQYLYDGERLSLGTNKINGENNLYKVRQSYFPILTPAQRKYVKFRHYAVLAFACKRSKRWAEAVKYALCAVASSPMYCLKEAPKYFGKAKKA